MITLRAEITKTIDGSIQFRYNWILQSKHHFVIRIIKSQQTFMRLFDRYSKWMTKTILDPEIVSISRTGEKVVILETEFV